MRVDPSFPMDKLDEAAKAIFVQILGMDLKSAITLVENEITSLEEVAYVPFSELVSIEGLQEPQLQAWRQRARDHLLCRINDDGDDEEPQPVVALNPLSPMSGGSCAPTEDNEKE